jgi:hypothetical protein
MQQALSSEHDTTAAPKKGKNRKGGQADQKRGAARSTKESTAEVEKGKNRKDGHVEQKRGRGARRAKKEPTAGGVDKSLVERYRSKFLQHGLSKTKDS